MHHRHRNMIMHYNVCIESRCNVKYNKYKYSSSGSRYFLYPMIIAFGSFIITVVYYKGNNYLHKTIPDVKEPLQTLS